MNNSMKTKIATIIRQHEQGILSDSEAYHAICNLYMEAL